MPGTPPVLVLSNDLSPGAANTTRHLCIALGRMGRTAIARDTRLPRWAGPEAGREFSARRDAYEELVVAKWSKFVFEYGFETVISLDLDWLFSARLFLPFERITHIHSIWTGDVALALKNSPVFPAQNMSTLDLLTSPKLHHHACGMGLVEDLRAVGITPVAPFLPGAPSADLESEEPCVHPDRMAYIDAQKPWPSPTAEADKALLAGESRDALRRLARDNILKEWPALKESNPLWRECPGFVNFLAAVLELRLARPHVPAVLLIAEAGTVHPDSYDFLQQKGLILEMARLAKRVHQYDALGLVLRLHRRGWLDVFGPAKEWKRYGVRAQPAPVFAARAAHFRRYAIHLNGLDSTGDAVANESLFEMAACGRYSLNLDRPGLREAYSNEEISLVASDDEFEAVAESARRDPEAALVAGAKARRRTAQEHLWEHRLKQVLA